MPPGEELTVRHAAFHCDRIVGRRDAGRKCTVGAASRRVGCLCRAGMALAEHGRHPLLVATKRSCQ